MRDMTMGQRIAECRRKLGISQEALGEKVGVSRQAISKWEADGAVPEIDKLITLSKLFQVSVGWLLGVEEAPAPPPEEKAEISEELLRKIEEIVLRYRPRKQPLSTKKKVLIGLCIALLLWGGLTFAGHWSRLSLNVATTSAQVRTNNEQNARIMEQLDALESRMDEPESPLLSSYRFDVVPIRIESEVDTSDAEIHFTAAPTLWREGDRGILSIRHADTGTLQSECTWDGSYLTGKILLGSGYGYEMCFTIQHADGTQEQQVLTDTAVENLSATLSIPVTTGRGAGHFNQVDGQWELTLKEYSVSVERPKIAQEGDLWERVEYVLYLHRDMESQQIATYDLLPPIEEDDPFFRAATIEFGGDQPVFTLPEMQEGDGLVLWINVEMTNGMHTFTIVDQWHFRDGDFENLGGVYEYQ